MGGVLVRPLLLNGRRIRFKGREGESLVSFQLRPWPSASLNWGWCPISGGHVVLAPLLTFRVVTSAYRSLTLTERHHMVSRLVMVVYKHRVNSLPWWLTCQSLVLLVWAIWIPIVQHHIGERNWGIIVEGIANIKHNGYSLYSGIWTHVPTIVQPASSYIVTQVETVFFKPLNT